MRRVITLAVENGQGHLLDLKTGSQRTQIPAALRSLRRIPQGAVSQARVERVLATAGIRTSHDAEGDTLAHLQRDEVNLVVAPERLLIWFIKVVEIGDLVPDQVKQAVVGRLNSESDLVRIRLLDEQHLGIDYSMTYERGFVPVQLVQMLREFTCGVRAALTSEVAAELLGQE